MVYLRVFVFIFFVIALYGSIECLIDSERVLEHSGAWFGVCTCVAGCAFAMIRPEKLL